jgi:hypothetical protein
VEPVEPVEPTEESERLALPDRMDVSVEHYSDRAFAVYVNGELLCVTAYKKGAMAVKALVESLWERINTPSNQHGCASILSRIPP